MAKQWNSPNRLRKAVQHFKTQCFEQEKIIEKLMEWANRREEIKISSDDPEVRYADAVLYAELRNYLKRKHNYDNPPTKELKVDHSPNNLIILHTAGSEHCNPL